MSPKTQVARVLKELGFKKVPVGENGRADVWIIQEDRGLVRLTVEVFRQNGVRLVLEIGVILSSVSELLSYVSSRLLPWGGRRWHPDFDFGWELGQSSAEFLNKRLEDRQYLGETGGGLESQGDQVISFLGRKGAIFISEDPRQLEKEVESIRFQIESVALPVFRSSAKKGVLSVEIIRDRRRLSERFAPEIVQCVGYCLLGERNLALSSLEEHEEAMRRHGWRGGFINHEETRALVEDVINMSASEKRTP